MGYSHIGIEERRQIARLLKAGTTIRQIAASLDRSPSAISREINRNRLTSGEYKPVQANERSQARRWRGPRLDRDDLLREAVLWRLAWDASPEQVAGRLALEMGVGVGAVVGGSSGGLAHAAIRHSKPSAGKTRMSRRLSQRVTRGLPALVLNLP